MIFSPSKLSRLSKAWIIVLIAIVFPIIVIIISLVQSLEPISTASALTAVILLYLSLIYRQFGEQFGELEDDLNSLKTFVANSASIVPVSEPDFYDRFWVDAKQADNRVWISYLDNKNPVESNDEEKVEYYEQIGDLIEDKSARGVEFKRIVRGIPELDPWIRILLEEREGIFRYSLACLPDNDPDQRSKPHISVQLIDDELTYFVAVGEQQQSVEPRDMLVRSMELSDQWSRYYDQLWNECYEILRRGEIQPRELEAYEAHLESLEEDE